MSGWIKLHRSLTEWEWWDDHNTTRLLTYLLCSVNYETGRWQGIIIPPGSTVTSFDKLAIGTGLSVKSVRNSMNKLELCGEVVRRRARKGQLVTLCKWEKLQLDIQKGTTNESIKGHLKGSQGATIKELKNNKEKEESKKSPFSTDVEKAYTFLINHFPPKSIPKTTAQVKNWKDVIDKLNRIEKYSFKEICEIVIWAREDKFWKNEFLSILKLRRKNNDGIKYVDYMYQKIEAQIESGEAGPKIYTYKDMLALKEYQGRHFKVFSAIIHEKKTKWAKNEDIDKYRLERKQKKE